uniref:Uncharacterized protein n=1 Tax=Physcomitrium patens TaxID=3218 RepID=A0A2K1KPZ8_PHYPA|nr:hypothetical protein PHYPA_006744 [Physcomitrium patens]
MVTKTPVDCDEVVLVKDHNTQVISISSVHRYFKIGVSTNSCPPAAMSSSERWMSVQVGNQSSAAQNLKECTQETMVVVEVIAHGPVQYCTTTLCFFYL